MIRARRPAYVATANVDFVVQARDDVELRRILLDAHLVLCDGMPLVWASRLLGNPLPERVPGSDLVPRLLAEAERQGWRVFFLGGTPTDLDQATQATRSRHPRLQLAGSYSPPFRPLLDLDHDEIRNHIHAARPDLLLVAFGCPKQEKWINMHYRTLGVPVSIGVGASLAFLGGSLRRAPRWMQRTGTEWLHRLLQEPRRLASRYSKGLWVFTAAFLRQWLALRTRPARPTTPSPDSTAPTRSPPPAQAPGPTILTFPSRLDAVSAARLNPEALAAASRGPVVADLSATRFIDSTGVGLLVRLRKETERHGHSLALRNTTTEVNHALDLMKIREFFASPPHPPAPPPQLPDWQGEITAANREAFAAHLEPRIAAATTGSSVTVDLAQVPFVDSSAIGMFLALRKKAWQRQVRLVFTHPTAPVRNVMRLTRLETVLLGEDPA
jgi:N-acetylglucosaminyldiphosphoundecaprenol N-acetyl-beta-D-mannosaminyltransferase